jgi:hypothetical protein
MWIAAKRLTMGFITCRKFFDKLNDDQLVKNDYSMKLFTALNSI